LSQINHEYFLPLIWRQPLPPRGLDWRKFHCFIFQPLSFYVCVPFSKGGNRGRRGGKEEEEEAHSGIAHGLSSLALFNISLLRVTAYVL
jgi:hypothetical protein